MSTINFLNQSHRFPIRDVNILKAPNGNNFLNRISIAFNNLPENIRSQTKFSSFKNLSFRHFMSHAWPYFRHLTDNSFSVSHLIQLPLLNSIIPFCFILFIIFLSHHGKHSKEWCCLTIKVYMYVCKILSQLWTLGGSATTKNWVLEIF